MSAQQPSAAMRNGEQASMPGSTRSGALLVIGGTGELGSATVIAACAEGGWDGAVYATYRTAPPNAALKSAAGRAEWIHLDCTEHKEVRSLLASASRRIVAVVYCAVPKHRGANESGAAPSVRAGIVDDVVAAAEAAAMCGARFVAVSTDLVFDGNLPAGELYKVDSPLSPSNAYGKFKADMERQLKNISSGIVIARSSLILSLKDDSVEGSTHGKAIRFVLSAINGDHGQIELFEDELRCMSFADDLGAALVELASPECTHSGVIHIVSDEVTNRWELAKKLARKYGLDDKIGKFATCGLSKESGLNRPLNCALDSELTRKVLKTKIRGISERLN